MRIAHSHTPRLLLAAFSGAVWWSITTTAQQPPVNGMRPADPRCAAITDATVVAAPGQKIEHATIIMRDGVIEAVGPNDQMKVPAEARVWKGEGLTVYPGLIESALLIRPENMTRGPGSHWNTRVHAEVSMSDQ